MKPSCQTISTLLTACALSVAVLAQQPPPASPDTPSGPLAEAQQKMREGHHSEALAIYRKVLADTPDFLRDAPEDDELWFEQGKPKDFDF